MADRCEIALRTFEYLHGRLVLATLSWLNMTAVLIFETKSVCSGWSPISQEFPPPPPPRPSSQATAKFKAIPPELQAQLERMRGRDALPRLPPKAPPTKARPVGPRPHSKAVSPVGPRRDEIRSRSPRTSDATPVPMAAPPPEPVRYSDTAVPVPLNLAEGQGTPLEQALAGESVAWN